MTGSWELSEFTTIALAAVGGIVWLVRSEGSLTKESALRQALADRIDGFEARIYRALERIENKLDGHEVRERDNERERRDGR